MNEQSPARCTCPTGDGSLEHPCPAHLTECAPGAINLIDALLENPAIPMAAKARLRNIRGTVVALQERSPKDHGFDFVAHLERQKRFSAHTFGPGTRAHGIVDHIRKELLEVEADPGDLCEWVDVAILALDGAWRSGATPQEIAAAFVTKQTKNESRVWPHWSTMPADKAIEHDRSGEKPRSTPAAPGIDPADPWRGLYAPELMPKLDGVNDWIAAHPDLPQWPDDEERGIDNLIKAQGFAYAVVGDEYPDEDEAVELDPCAWLANWKPEPPAGEHWRLVMVQDAEDGPAAVFVRPLALIDAAPAIDLERIVPPEWVSEQVGSQLDEISCGQAWRMGFNECRSRTELLIDQALGFPERTDASPKGGSHAEPMFYIQDTRSFVGNCPVWWGPGGRGYVTRLDEAGRYTEEEAIRKNRSRDTDLPWPCAEIDKLGRLTVDVQHMRPRCERLAELTNNRNMGA